MDLEASFPSSFFLSFSFSLFSFYFLPWIVKYIFIKSSFINSQFLSFFLSFFFLLSQNRFQRRVQMNNERESIPRNLNIVTITVSLSLFLILLSNSRDHTINAIRSNTIQPYFLPIDIYILSIIYTYIYI